MNARFFFRKPNQKRIFIHKLGKPIPSALMHAVQQYCSNHFFSSPIFGHSMKTELDTSIPSSARNFSASTSDIRESIPRSTKGASGVSSEGSRPVSRVMICFEVSIGEVESVRGAVNSLATSGDWVGDHGDLHSYSLES